MSTCCPGSSKRGVTARIHPLWSGMASLRRQDLQANPPLSSLTATWYWWWCWSSSLTHTPTLWLSQKTWERFSSSTAYFSNATSSEIIFVRHHKRWLNSIKIWYFQIPNGVGAGQQEVPGRHAPSVRDPWTLGNEPAPFQDVNLYLRGLTTDPWDERSGILWRPVHYLFPLYMHDHLCVCLDGT